MKQIPRKFFHLRLTNISTVEFVLNTPLVKILDLNQGGGYLKRFSKNRIIRRILKIWKNDFLKIALNQGGI